MRIGFGVDIHRFGEGDHLQLGGVRVPSPYGVIAHSDGDVVLHALCDALLGAAGLGDIGIFLIRMRPGAMYRANDLSNVSWQCSERTDGLSAMLM